MTELLLGTPLNAEQRHQARVTQRCAEDLLRLTDAVLDFARIDAGSQRLEEQDFAPRELAEQALRRVAERAAAKGLSLRLEAPEALPERLHADAGRIAQVLAHLLDNALKFTEQGGVLLRVTHGPTQHLEFEIRDSGIGVDPAELSRLIQPFTQADASLARPHAGAGLGLALAQQLLQLLGGSLRAERLDGGGSAFGFVVPVQNIQASIRPASTPQLPGLTPLEGRYILVVEDNQVNQEVIAQMLGQLGCRVRLAASALAGLQALQDERFDLVMMDIHMPGMDGMEALSRFRRSHGGRTAPGTPVVAVTANALSGDEDKLLRHGFDDYLPKPFRQSHLLAMLTRRLHDSTDSEEITPAAVAADAAMPHDGKAMPSSPTPDASSTVLDAQALARLRDLDPDGANKLIERVVAAYMKSLERLLPDLARARGEALDLNVVRHVSHTLKSSSASLGALHLAQRCAEIETLARHGHTDGLEALLDAMLEEIAEVRLALTALPNTP
jgi:CheY-like chemotaxis protein/anti-sigma regulatory factor (Ser/Thr protein kinase)